MQVSFHRVHDGRSGGLGLCIALSHRHRMLQARAERKTLQDAILGPRARLLDGGVNLHGLAVLATTGTVRHYHLLHQVGIGQQLVHQAFLVFSLLGEFS